VADTKDSRSPARGLKRSRALSLALGLVAIVGAANGCRESGSTEATARQGVVPAEIVSQLSSIERAMNARSASELAPILDDRASIQTVGLLGYGSKKQFLDSLGSDAAQAPFTFGETILVSERPDKVRTVSEVIRRFGEEQVVERVSHEWVRQGDRWVVKEQSFPDWSPLVGAWWRSEGDAKVALKFMPSGVFEMSDTSGIVVRRGVYATGIDEVAFTPDALGSGATSERPIDASYKFEFDGSLEMVVVSGSEDAGIPSLGGIWKRQSMR
jgi:hypothetical protein